MLKKNWLIAGLSLLVTVVMLSGCGKSRPNKGGASSTTKLSNMEIYELQRKLGQQSGTMTRFDRGQGFGAHIDDFEKYFQIGCYASSHNDMDTASDALQRAEAEAKWLVANAPLREQTQEIAAKTEQVERAADALNAAKRASRSYEAARRQVASAIKHVEAGKFEAAIREYTQARDDFRKSIGDARKVIRDEYIREAEIARDKRDWHTVMKCAGQLYQYDYYAKAKELKALADEGFKTDLPIAARSAADKRQWDKVIDCARTIWRLDPVKAGEWERLANEGIKQDKLNSELAAARQAKADEQWTQAYFHASAALVIVPGHAEATQLKKEAGANFGIMTVMLPGNIEMKLVKVETGSFEMSARDGENEKGEIPHRVMLEHDFFIGQTEVTQAQWKAVMETDPSYFKGEDLPVEQVSWNDAMEFCDKLNKSGKAPTGFKFSLPTETQWEYAARGGRKSKGYKYSGSNNADEVAWYYNNSGDRRLEDNSYIHEKCEDNRCRTHSVGKKCANELGLYDMSGNVDEWCLDDYEPESIGADTEFSRGNDKDNVMRVFFRVTRGGSWADIARYSRSARRDSLGSSYKDSRCTGFRVALVPEKYHSNKEHRDRKAEEARLKRLSRGDIVIELPGNVKLAMVKVEAGTFTMSVKDSENHEDEVPHRVTLTHDFFIGQTEVTRAQWYAVMGGTLWGYCYHPVSGVSWNKAMGFCKKLNEMGKAPEGWKFTLPTETQWEYAARGGRKSKGYKYSGSNNVDEVAWHIYNSGQAGQQRYHSVATKKANELGLYDMSGNVCEWCIDKVKVKHDLYPKFAPYYVRRGGDYRDHGVPIIRSDSSSRLNYASHEGDEGIGFRLVLVQVK